MKFKIPKDTQERLRANQRAIEGGSATPPRYWSDAGRFLHGYCYLALIPEEWKSSVAMTIGKFASLPLVLALMQNLWNDHLLILGPTRDWRVTFGSKIVPPRPGEQLILHIERNGSLTFEECNALLEDLLTYPLDIIVGYDTEMENPQHCELCEAPFQASFIGYNVSEIGIDAPSNKLCINCVPTKVSRLNFPVPGGDFKYIEGHVLLGTKEIVPSSSLPDGFCWLLFIADSFRQQALNTLGMWPTRARISEFINSHAGSLTSTSLQAHLFSGYRGDYSRVYAHIEEGSAKPLLLLSSIGRLVPVGGLIRAQRSNRPILGSCFRGLMTDMSPRTPNWATVNRVSIDRGSFGEFRGINIVANPSRMTTLSGNPSTGLTFDMRSGVPIGKIPVETTRIIVEYETVPGKVTLPCIGYCSICRRYAVPSRSWFRKECRYCGALPGKKFQRTCRDEAEALSYGLVPVVSGETKRRVERLVTEVTYVDAPKPVAIKPFVTRRVPVPARRMVARDDPSRVIAAINANNAFAGILHRFRTLGQEKLRKATGKFHAPAFAPPKVDFTSVTRFSGLTTVPLNEDGGENPFVGLVQPAGHSKRMRSREDQLYYINWVERNLERKSRLFHLERLRHVRKSIRPSSCASIPLSEDFKEVLGQIFPHHTSYARWFTEINISLNDFKVAVYIASTRYTCPASKMTLLWKNGVAKCLSVGKTPGLSVLIAGETGTFAHFGKQQCDECSSGKISVCKTLAQRNGISEGTKCTDSSREARILITVKRPPWHYALCGNKIAFNVNSTIIVTRRTNVFRIIDDKLIGLKQDKLFWSSPVLYLTLAGLKRFYLEKRDRKKGAYVMQMSIAMGFKAVKDFHEFMERVSIDMRYPDVVPNAEDVNLALYQIEADLSKTKLMMHEISEQVRDLAVCAQMTAPSSRTLTRTFKVSDAVAKFEATPRVANMGYKPHKRTPSTDHQTKLKMLTLSPRPRQGSFGSTNSEPAVEPEKDPHTDILVDGDVEANPGPVDKINTNVPFVGLLSATPQDYMDRMRRRWVSEEQNNMTYTELINDVINVPSKQETLREHLHQRVKDCKDRIPAHCLWREKWLRVANHDEFKTVTLATIKREDTLFHSFISSATLQVNADAQYAVETIGFMTHYKRDKSAPEHIASELHKTLSTYTCSYDRDEVIHLAITWKACRGCPEKGMFSVLLDTTNSSYSIRWSDETPPTGGQINWMVNGDLLAHCGSAEERGRSRSHARNLSAPSYADAASQRARSRSRSGTERLQVSPGFSETISRAVSPLRSRITKETRLMTITGAEEFGLDSFFADGESKEFLRKYVLNQGGDVENIYHTMEQHCDVGVKSRSTIKYLQHKLREADFAQIVENAPLAYPKVQEWIDWIGKHKFQNDIDDIDPRGSGDFVNGVYGAFELSCPGIELCSIIGMALAWKKRWGCPRDEVWIISCMPEMAEWTIHTFDDYKAKKPGLYWFWDGKLICHCGTSEINESKYVPRIDSPYRVDIETKRYYPRLEGHVALDMRHRDQHSGHIRNKLNAGMHQLPLDFLEDVDKAKAPWFDDVLVYIRGINSVVESWAYKHKYKYICVTANMNHNKCKWPVVNFVSSGYEAVEEREDGKWLTIHTKFNGPALRNIRAFPCFFPSTVSGYMIANGPLGDWEQIVPLDPECPLMWPKCRIWWIGAYAANNLWVRPDCLSKTVSLRQWINPMTVYGGDEVIFSKMHINTVLDKPINLWQEKPFLGYLPHMAYPVNVTMWNKTGTILGHYDIMNPTTMTELYHKFFPGRPVIDKVLHPSQNNYVPFKKVHEQPEFLNAIAWVHDDKWGKHNPRYMENPPCTKPGCAHPKFCPSVFYQCDKTCTDWASKQEPIDPVTIFIIKCWVWLTLYLRYNRSFSNPTFSDDTHPWVSESSEEYPSHIHHSALKNTLSIQTLGTTGDTIPMKYLANVAAHVGVPTHLNHRHMATTEDLENLRRGWIFPLLPAYSDLTFASRLGFGATLQPHTSPNKTGAEYTLSPPRKWIKIQAFPKYIRKLPWLNAICLFIMNVNIKIQRPTFVIGAISGSSIPRAINGRQALTKKKNYGTHEAGWTSGSADPACIPEYIRKQFPEIPKGDHSEIFRHYKVIHCHGGAGTMQTAISCGAKPISHDDTLDRNYVKQLEPKHFKQPSIYIYYGWLLNCGFKTRLPWLARQRAWFAYHMHMKQFYYQACVTNLIRGYVLALALMNYHILWLTLAISVPHVFITLVSEFVDLSLIIRAIKFLWDYPFLVVCDTKLMVIMGAWHLGAFHKAWQDIMGYYKREFSLVWEPVTRGGVKTVWPIGHYSIRDNHSGLVYEGRFTRTDRGTTLGSHFKFTKSARLYEGEHRIYPVQVRLSDLEKLLEEEGGAYHAGRNCTTYVLRVLYNRSLTATLCLGGVTALTYVGLFGGSTYEWVMKIWEPDFLLRNSRAYDALGFAAGIEVDDIDDDEILPDAPVDPNITTDVFNFNLSTQIEDETDPPVKTLDDPNLLHDVQQINSEQCLPELMKEIATITAICLQAEPDMEKEIREAGNRTLAGVMANQELPSDPMLLEEPVPEYQPGNWQQVRDALHEAFSSCKRVPFVAECLMFIKHMQNCSEEVVIPVTKLLLALIAKIYDHGAQPLNKAWKAFSKWLDFAFGPVLGNRLKTAWGPTGLFKSSYLNPLRDLEENIAKSKFVGRTTFLKDYEAMVADIKRHAAHDKRAKEHLDLIGGPQVRPINIKAPVMSKNEATMLGLKEGEYQTTDHFEMVVNGLLAQGVPQGSDGVFFAQRNPDRIDDSFARYEHQYSREFDPSTEALIIDCAQAIYNRFPSSFKDAKMVSMASVTNYLKLKYSSGIPFINSKETKTRQMLQDKGFLSTLQSLATEYLREGKFPVEFFHGFEKSQVVDLGKILAGKNVRTVVANFILTTYMEHIFQLDRNKRETWEETGLGSGMPMNQSMARIWEEMADKMKLHGGRFLIADATEYDSKLHPLIFLGAAELDRLSFKDHPNGENIASVFVAKYDALQKAWIIGITRPTQNTLCISAPDEETFKLILRQNIDGIVSIDDKNALDEQKMNGKVLLVRDKRDKPRFAHYNGSFMFGDPKDMKRKEWDHVPFIYEKRGWRDMIGDIKELVRSDFALSARAYSKDQGGATGFTSTTFTNSWGFRIGIIAAWCLTTGKQPWQFFGDDDQVNVFKNTSDDTLWWAAHASNLNSVKDIYAFQQNCKRLGIHLTLETTRDITKAEYLSKTVTPPTREDAEDIQSWKTWKLRHLMQAGKDVTNEQLLKKFDNPRFIVKQNVRNIGLRRTALLWHKGSPSKYLYAMITRDAGHAMVSAFRRGLYLNIAESYCASANALLKQHNIWQKYEVRWETPPNAKTKMPHVIQTNPRWVEQKLSPRQMAVIQYIKQQAKFPSYLKVIDVHMNIKTMDPQGHAKFLAKLAKGTKGWDSAARDVVDWLRTVTDKIPERFADKFMPGVQAIYPDNPFYTRNDWVCKFAMSDLLTTNAESDIDYPMLQQRVGQSPYGNISNPLLFWERWQDPKFKEDFYKEDHRLYKAMVLMISIIYNQTERADKWISKIPLIGPCWQLYTWSYVARRKLYAFANTINYHATSQSSPTISAMMPKDPHIVGKRVSAVIADFIPIQIGYLLFPFTHIIDELVAPFHIAVRLQTKMDNVKPIEVKHNSKYNPWIDFADDYVQKVTDQPNQRLYVSAPTGTGKSTFFPGAILATKHKHKVQRIWMVMPRIILREEWKVPFKIKVQKLKKGVKMEADTDIFVCTYGHFLNRMNRVNPITDLVLFDEFHEQSGEMILAENKLKARVILLSATPAALENLKTTPTMVPPIKKRFVTTIHKFDDNRNVIQMFQTVKNLHPDTCDDTLIIVPTIAEIDPIIASLQWLGHTGHELSSRSRKVPKTGIIVATPYVDVGLDIDPPRMHLIDSGRCIAIDRGRKVTPNPPTDPARNKQRIGRVGRNKPGFVWQNKVAGTGKTYTNYCSGFMMENVVLAKHYGLPQLTPIPNHIEGCSFLSVNPKKIGSKEEQKSILALHLIALQGEKEVNFKRLYSRLRAGERLGEEYWWLTSIIETREWLRTSMLPWEEALTLLSIQDAVAYGINNTIEYRPPIQPVQGVWHDVHLDTNAFEEAIPGAREEYDPMYKEMLSDSIKLDRIKTIMGKLSKSVSDTLDDAVKAAIIADVSRVTASILTA